MTSGGDTYNQSGQFGIGHQSGGLISGDAKIAGVINESDQHNLSQVILEVQQIIEPLSQSYPTTSTTQQMIVAAEAIQQIENTPNLKHRLISAARAGGLAAFEKVLDNPIGAFVTTAIRDWIENNDC